MLLASTASQNQVEAQFKLAQGELKRLEEKAGV
jgi:hypothetical protein